ncbi:serine/threonine-protein kinase [Sphaerisporangium sp. NPDC005289]|uniref:WD40 repeat domain-containing serine/threonine protein kinase n=1 Tax=Sphaerisporangium sp. NPDC005289 TaxID=3155247 RepID=UPI0033BE6D11
MAGRLSPDDPERLGGYWLAGRLGAGGQGVVYEAYDEEGRRVALKVVHGGAAGDPELRDRFGREASAARRVASFCTARVIAAELDGERPFIVSEYVEGPSLRRAVQDGRAFTGDDLHRLGTAVATALAAVHEAGVVHRDLKPDNVLLGPDGPRVIDFGIARTLEMSLTTTGLVAGTPTYMAPEVFTGQRAGAPADVFAWGGVMLFAATGEDPFKAESLGGVMHRVLSVDPDLDVLPASLRPLVAAALRKEPQDRPTATDLLLGLISGGEGAGTARLLERGSAAAGRVGPAQARDPALGTLAEDAYGMLSPAERDLAPEVFLRMVAIGPDGEPVTRPARADELPAGAENVLRVFAYVLSHQDGEVRLVRPALLGAWPRLRSWVRDEHEGLPVHAGILAQARQWDEHGRRDGDVLQGGRLDAAVRWAATGRRRLTLNPLERDFLDASAALTRRRARRRRLLTAALAVLLVVSLAAGGLAVYQGARVAEQRDQITAQRDRAKGRELAYLSGTLRTADPAAAMLLSVAAYRLDGGAEARSSLMSSLYQPETAVFTEPPVRDSPSRALSGDGRLMVSVSPGEIRLYDLARGLLIRRVPTPATRGLDVREVALSSDGRLVAISTADVLIVWDLRAGRERGRLRLPGGSLWTRVAFGTGGSTLTLVDDDSEPYVWDLATDRTYGRHHWRGSGPVVSAKAHLAALVATENGLRAYRLPGGTEDRRFREACPSDTGVAAFSADGATLACAGWTVRLVTTGTGKRIPYHEDEDWRWPEGGALAGGGSLGLRFSPDGRLLLGFADRDITVWRVADQRRIFSYRADGEVDNASLGSDGRTLRFLMDGTVVTLDVRPRVTTTGPGGKVFKTGLSPDARWMSAELSDSTPIRLWDVRRRRYAGVFPGTADSGVPADFDPRGRTAVTVTGGTLRAFDIPSLTPLWSHRLPSGFDSVGGVFSQDGATYAAVLTALNGSAEFPLPEWDARTGRLIRTLRPATGPGAIAFTPDGRTIATSAGRLLDAVSGAQVGPPFNSAPSLGVLAVSPAGGLLASGGGAGRVALYDTRTRSAVPPVLRGVAEPIALMSFSPDGRLLATVSESRTVQLWDVDAKRRIGVPVKLFGDFAMSMAFDPDGSALTISDQSGTLYRLPAGAGAAATAVCARAGRTLTRAEWTRYLPGIPYRDVCRS